MSLVRDDKIGRDMRSPIEIFIIANSIDEVGRRKTIPFISPNLSRCQYFLLLSILKAIIEEGSDRFQM